MLRADQEIHNPSSIAPSSSWYILICRGSCLRLSTLLSRVVMLLWFGRGVACRHAAALASCIAKSGYHKSCCLLTFPVSLCWPELHGPWLVSRPCKIISCLPVNTISIDQFPAGLYWFSLIQCKCFACRKGSINVPMRSKSVPLFLFLFKSYCHSYVAFLHSVRAYSWREQLPGA